jgi:threonyl-tRNA synthetase
MSCHFCPSTPGYSFLDLVIVISPNMYNSKLWETSGHWQNYKDDMFLLDVEKEKWALKPMNCPGHCLIFDSKDRSYKELPIRMAEFGIIHRNEASGALTGLTRVRRFVQDDTHVFCMPSQVRDRRNSTECFEYIDIVIDRRGDWRIVRFYATRICIVRLRISP